MELETYKEKVKEVLQAPLSVDSPETMFNEVAVIESLAYLAVRLAAAAETKLSTLNEKLRKERDEYLGTVTGTQMEKSIKLESLTSATLKEISNTEIEMKYWRSVGKLIENKISLAQSVLANITSQVKAGLYFNNVK